MNKQINQLPDVTSGFSSDSLIPVQLADGTTGHIPASELPSGSIPELSDVLDQSNYTNGYDIIVNAGSKIKSNTSVGEDYILPGNGFIDIQSNDGDVNTTRIIVYPTELSISKINTAESVDESTILFRTDGLHLLSKSTDLVYDNSIVYGTNGNINSSFIFNDGTTNSRITKDSSISTGAANEVELYYTKGEAGELTLQIEKDTTYYSSVVSDGANQNIFTQTSNTTTIQSDNMTITKINSDLRLFIEGLQVFNNNSDAINGGLSVNEVYRKNSGELMIVH